MILPFNPSARKSRARLKKLFCGPRELAPIRLLEADQPHLRPCGFILARRRVTALGIIVSCSTIWANGIRIPRFRSSRAWKILRP